MGPGISSTRVVGHAGEVSAVALSPNGRYAASASRDRTIRVWEVAAEDSSRVATVLQGHGDPVAAVAFSANSEQLVSISSDCTVRVWNVRSGKCLHLTEFETDALCAAWAPNDEFIVVGFRDGVARIFRPQLDRAPDKLEPSAGSVKCCCISASSGLIAVGCHDNVSAVFSSDGEPMRKLKGPRDIGVGSLIYVSGLSFSRDESKLVAGSTDMTIRLWALGGLRDGKLIWSSKVGMKMNMKVLSVAFSPGGKRIAVGLGSVGDETDFPVLLISTDDPDDFVKLEGHTDSVPSVVFSSDGNRILSGSWDRSCRLWTLGGLRDAAIGVVEQIPYGKSGRRSNNPTSTPQPQPQPRASAPPMIEEPPREHHPQPLFPPRSVTHELEPSTPALPELPNLSVPSRQWAAAHRGDVNTVAVSADGRWAASGSRDRTIMLWDFEAVSYQGQVVRTLKGHLFEVFSVAFSPDSKKLVSASFDETVRVWHVKSGECLETIEHPSGVSCVACSPDGSFFISGCLDGAARIFEWTAFDFPEILGERSWGQVNAVAVSQYGEMVAIGGTSCLAVCKVRGHGAPLEIFRIDNFRKGVMGCAFSPDDSCFAACSGDGVVRMCDLGGKLLWFTTLSGSTRSLSFSPGGFLLAVGGGDDFKASPVTLISALSGNVVTQLDGHGKSVRGVAFGPKGEKILSGASDKTCRLWMLPPELLTFGCSTSPQLRTYSPREEPVVLDPLDAEGFAPKPSSVTRMLFSGVVGRHESGVRSVAISTCGKLMATASMDQKIKVWDVYNTDRARDTLSGAGMTKVKSVAFSPNGKMLVCGSDDGCAHLWDVDTASYRWKLSHPNWVSCVAWAPDDSFFATACGDRRVRLWHPSSEDCLHILDGHTQWCRCVAISADSSLLASGGMDGLVIVWEIPSAPDPVQMLELSGHEKTVTGVAFSPDMTLIASASEDRTVQMWSLSGELLRTLSLDEPVWSVAFNTRSSLLAVGCGSWKQPSSVLLVDPDSGEILRDFSGHTGVVHSVVFHPSNERIISGSEDGTCRMWRVSPMFVIRNAPSRSKDRRSVRLLSDSVDADVTLNNKEKTEEPPAPSAPALEPEPICPSPTLSKAEAKWVQLEEQVEPSAPLAPPADPPETLSSPVSSPKDDVNLQDDAPVCVVCMSEAACFAAIPCGHRILCKQCMEHKSGLRGQCPSCRGKFEIVVRIF